ncbi:MAG TPA: hypothetical protein PKV41_00225, partial [Candidatus Omnitrophota bacterium]|nr:hypothetical protein [Candidatus Omnitrophota bacterium]
MYLKRNNLSVGASGARASGAGASGPEVEKEHPFFRGRSAFERLFFKTIIWLVIYNMFLFGGPINLGTLIAYIPQPVREAIDQAIPEPVKEAAQEIAKNIEEAIPEPIKEAAEEFEMGVKDAYANPDTEFVSTIMQSGGEYSTLATWEAANQVDLTSTATRVFSWDAKGSSGVPADGYAVWKASDHNVTATCVHVATPGAATGQILLSNIAGGTFTDNDVVQYQSDTNYSVTLSNTGDSAISVAKIDGVWTSPDNSTLEIDGWNTSSAQYIKIYTTATARHKGEAGTGYYLKPTYSGGSYFQNYNTENCVRLEGLEFDGSGITNVTYIIIWDNFPTGTAEIRIEKCIFHDFTAGNDYFVDGLWIDSGSQVYKISNNIIYNITGHSNNGSNFSDAIVNSSSGSGYVYNNTIYNIKEPNAGSGGSALGIYNTAGTMNCYNNVVLDVVSTGTDEACYYGYMVGDNNVSSDDTGIIRGETDYVDYFIDITSGSEDFHLKQTDTVLKNTGTSLSGDGNLPITDDIDGSTRADGSYDIGADEAPRAVYYSVGTSTANLMSGSPTMTIGPFVRSKTSGTGTTNASDGTFTVNAPATIVNGDLLVVIVSKGTYVGTTVTGSGFTLGHQNGSTTGNDVYGGMFYKVANNESGNYIFDSSGTNESYSYAIFS